MTPVDPAASSAATAFLNSRDPGALLLTTFAFLVGLALIWYLTSQVAGADKDSSAKSLNRLVALIGGLCGWVLGMLFTPYSDSEAKQFAAVSTVVSVFLSGYVVSKLDRFLEKTLFGDPKSQESWARAGLFAATLLLACVTLFTARLYAATNMNASGAIGMTPAPAPSAPKGRQSESGGSTAGSPASAASAAKAPASGASK